MRTPVAHPTPARLALALAALCLAFAACTSDADSTDTGDARDATAASDTADAASDTTSAPSPDYADPPELTPDEHGVYQLHFGPHAVDIDGQTYCLRSYNGVVPGPTLRIRARASAADARKVHVDLHNELAGEDWREVSGQEGHEHPTCHDFNVTNLHFHGGHVQPNAASADAADPCTGDGCAADQRYHGDDVLISVAPGEQARYRWDLDEDGTHHEGTDWYHPHIHGATAVQVLNGAAGAIIVEGPVDALPAVAAARERVMVLTELPLSDEHTKPLPAGASCDESTLSIDNFLSVTEGNPIQLNGRTHPRIVTPPGQVERWRMVYAGTPDEMGIKLYVGNDKDCRDWSETERVQLTQYARDGMTMPHYYKDDTVWVSPGYRVDSFVAMPSEPQTLCLVGRRVHDLAGSVIAIVDVRSDAGAPTTTTVPDEAEVTALAMPTSWTGVVDGVEQTVSCDSVTTIHQRVGLLMPPVATPSSDVMSDGGSCTPDGAHAHAAAADAPVCECPSPNINCRSFEARRARDYRSDRVAVVGSSERWQIVALDGHPYHIHINPFLVCPNHSNKEPNFAHWRDTMWVQAEDGPRDVMMRFSGFTGRFVEHCHKLNHEDEGMMELVEICAPDDLECQCQRFDDGQCVSQAGCQADDLQCQFAAAATAAYPLPPPPMPELCDQPPWPPGG
ncbi:MAG: multicopper oxidase domain-containing protein [Myxococcota bacterium]